MASRPQEAAAKKRIASGGIAKRKKRRLVYRSKDEGSYAMVAASDIKGLSAGQYSWITKISARGLHIMRSAEHAGLLRGEKSERVGGRVSHKLLSTAKAKSGIQSQTELLEYALSKVALEDDYGPKLLALKGSIPDDVEL